MHIVWKNEVQIALFCPKQCANCTWHNPVLENVRQRQQHCCQEMFHKISSQEIFVILYTGMPYNLLIV
jgi:hypothetical protein